MKNNSHLGFHFSLAGIALCLASLWLLAARTQGQSKSQPNQQAAAPGANLSSAPVIKKESRLVLVDAVVTDKKGDYISDLKQDNFRVYDDNKEQTITSFSFGSDPKAPVNSERRYVVLFFDNASMEMPDQQAARAAAAKFIEANVSAQHPMAVVEFTGALQVKQNFTTNAALLRAAATGAKFSSVASNVSAADALGSNSASAGITNNSALSFVPSSSLAAAAAGFGARDVLLAIRSLARNLQAVPGRKILILFSSGFPLTPELTSELSATIDACNRANVAIYALDARGLVGASPGPPISGGPGGSARNNLSPTFPSLQSAVFRYASYQAGSVDVPEPRLLLASFQQRPGPGGGGGHPGPVGPVGGGGHGGGPVSPGGGRGTGNPGNPGGTRGTGGGNPGGTRYGGGNANRAGFSNFYNNPFNQPRNLIPEFPHSASANQDVLAALAEGTGGFTIFNTNDLLGGLERIAREENEFYLLGYVPAEAKEGSCHTLKVKLEHVGGMHIRSRTGYCVAPPENILAGTDVEKQLEAHAKESNSGSIHAQLADPYFYSGPNVARVDVAMDIPSKNFHFEKEKGKYQANLNILGIAYNPDGGVGARFSDQVKLDLEKDQWKEFQKNPYHYENEFDAAPGTYNLVVVMSAGKNDFGKVQAPLKIDPYDGTQFSMGAAVLTNDAQPISQAADNADLDAALLEDHTPLVVKGLQIAPQAENQFKRSDRVIVYTEIYEPLLTSANPPRIVLGYKIFNRTTNKQVFFTGSIAGEGFIQKGNPVIPVGLKVLVKDLPPGKYRLEMLAIDGAGRTAPARTADFDLTG
jgi:VWFA-related protein